MNNTFTQNLKQYKELCDRYVSDGPLRDFLSTFSLDKEMGSYIDALVRHSDGGKRIRAYLTYLGFCIFRGFCENFDVLKASVSYELFQTGILAHDDIIDNSDFRRFKPSMHKDLGEGHDGVSKSICVGDFGIVSAIEIINSTDFDEKTKLLAISHQNKVFAATIAGELKDIEFCTREEVSQEEVLEMYRLKTAQYTVSGPLVLGAILAGANDDEISLLRKFGDNIGISFQIRDDILGMFADDDKTGKSNLSDMREGKKTVLVSHFYENASEIMKKSFSKVYGRHNATEQDLETSRTLLKSVGSFDYANSLCSLYVKKAENELEKMSLSDTSKLILTQFSEYMTTRNY